MSGDTPRAAWIVLGGIHLLNQTAPRRAQDPIVLVQVAPQEVCVPSTTVVIRWAELGACPVIALTVDGRRTAEAQIEGNALFSDAIAGPALREMVGRAAVSGLVPLCYLAEHPEGGYHAYAQIRFYADDACFVRTTPEPVGAGPAEALRWLEPVLTAHAASALRLNNHLRYFRTHFAGTELEYKHNLAPTTDIWALSMQLLKDLRHGELADCRPEYREEFQIHSFDNYMFDVTGPEHERGYASFIPTVNGTHVLKRKWFTQDAFARREQLFTDINVSADRFGEYLRSELGLQVEALPPFRRVRYDIQCESMRTGHVFGIFFDRCSLLTAPDVVLSQCEMEYLRSRSIIDHYGQEALREMERIDRWLLSYLSARGQATERTFYSKLSFLRDAVAARPGLAPTRCDHGRQDELPDTATRHIAIAIANSGGKVRHTEPVDVHLILRRDGTAGPEILLSRRTGQVYATGLWHLPSGHLDGPHEDVVAALIREAAEETSVAIDPTDVRFAVTVHHRSPGGSVRIGVFFEVRHWQGAPQILEPALCDAMAWYRLDDLPSPMVAYCRAGLDAYRTGDRLAVHYQQPADPIPYVSAADRLCRIPTAGDTGPARPEAPVREFTERTVGRIADWSDVSWAREGSRVWRARGTAGGTWFVKVHQNARFHDREVRAYRSWVSALGAATPRLVAADAALRAIVITAVPGRPLHGALHTPEEQRHIFQSIGALAATIHHSAPARPASNKPLLEKLEQHIDGARAHLAHGDEEFIRATAKRATRLPDLDLVPTHGDFQLRNLLWNDGALHVIDFERSEEGPAVRDFVRLSDAWAGRPDLHDATMAGYGRPLTSAEKEHLAVGSVLDAVSGIQYGMAHGDLELVERGHRTLARLRATDRGARPAGA